MSSKKPENKIPTPNMAEINKLITEATEALKNVKAENAQLTAQLVTEREKNAKLVNQIDKTTVLLCTAEVVMKNQDEFIRKLGDGKVSLEKELRTSNDMIAGLNQQKNILISANQRLDASRRLNARLFWIMVGVNLIEAAFRLLAWKGVI